MLNFIKKEQKIIIMTVLILMLVFAVNSFAIQPEKESAVDSKRKANASVTGWEKEIEKLFVYYYGKDLALATPRNHTKLYQQLNSDAREKEKALQNVVAFEVKENFRIPKKIIDEAKDEEYPQFINDYANLKIAALLDETYTKLESAKYKFVKPLNLDNSLVQDNMSFDMYRIEALPLMGLKEEKVNKIKDIEQKDMIIAEAEATMKLVQLNIVKAVIENARIAGVSRMEELVFVQRPKELSSRFNAKQNEPQYYRPIVIRVKITAGEQNIFDFIRLCIDPSPSGSSGEFLAIHSFLLNNVEALNTNTATLEVSAEMQLVAFIIDPNSPFSEFEKPKRKSLVPTYGYGPMYRANRANRDR